MAVKRQLIGGGSRVRVGLPVRLALALALAAASCKSKVAPDTDAPAGAADAGAEAAPPPEIRVTADRKDLIFGYATEDGQPFKTATSIDAVPETARRSVVVTDLSLTPEQRQSGRYIYLADLRTARPDGTYPVAIASRYGFEAKLAGTSTAAAGSERSGVVIYSASWCGVCKQAKQLLKRWNVPFIDKDIEASRSAAEELGAKARAAGIQPGGVPVIDVAGILLQGLDEGTLRAALKQKGLLR